MLGGLTQAVARVGNINEYAWAVATLNAPVAENAVNLRGANVDLDLPQVLMDAGATYAAQFQRPPGD